MPKIIKKIKFLFGILFLCQASSALLAQGLNHNWLLGYLDAPYLPYSPSADATLQFSKTNYSITGTSRLMKFRATQANISDSLGNILFYSNGGWIADATGDTMINGSGLSPSIFSTVYSDYGFPPPSMQIALPFPDSNNVYILFHQTSEPLESNSVELYYSIIDMKQNNGKGVVTQKNLIAFQDTILFGIHACKHANGRDWWIVTLRDSSDIAIKILLTPTGIAQLDTQHLNVPLHHNGYTQPMCFSPDGKKFAYIVTTQTGNSNYPSLRDLRIFDFDRCTGLFTNSFHFDLNDTFPGTGLSFSSNSRYLYTAKYFRISQFDLLSASIQASRQYVADYDTFFMGGYTDFANMYLGANGKIYISSTSTTIYFNVIDSPDSFGVSCNVLQHSLLSPTFLFFNHVNHPNYYLGCDTSLGCPCLSSTSLTENGQHDFRFRVYPNPVVNYIVNIGYILPQNKSGILKLYDVNGKQLYTQGLPPWSNEQSIKLPKLANGVYNMRIESGGYFMSRNLVVMRE
nr:T9SS type A sorting domain-containing protein [Bacteroidota bacterium]